MADQSTKETKREEDKDRHEETHLDARISDDRRKLRNRAQRKLLEALSAVETMVGDYSLWHAYELHQKAKSPFPKLNEEERIKEIWQYIEQMESRRETLAEFVRFLELFVDQVPDQELNETKKRKKDDSNTNDTRTQSREEYQEVIASVRVVEHFLFPPEEKKQHEGEEGQGQGQEKKRSVNTNNQST